MRIQALRGLFRVQACMTLKGTDSPGVHGFKRYGNGAMPRIVGKGLYMSKEQIENSQNSETEGNEHAGDQNQLGEAGGDAGGEAKPDPKYTDDELDAILKSRLARERAKWEAEIDKQRTEASEAEKLKSMGEQERIKYQLAKANEEIESLRSERDLNAQMKEARSQLTDAGISLPDELLSMFVSPTAEKTKEAVDSIKKLWPEAVASAVKDALKRNPPKDPDGASSGDSDGARYAKEYTNQRFTKE